MRILIAYYSRTGYTATLAQRIAEEMESRGHEVVFEQIEVARPKSRWNLLLRQIYQYPLVALCLASSAFRRWWLKRYIQPEDDLRPLEHPDVSEFDRVCIGGPKWCYISYPIARYLRMVKGLRGKKVSAFSTFAGPPLEVFEIELIFKPMKDRIEALGGALFAALGLSSNYHELGVLPIFKRVTPKVFERTLESFHIDSEYGKEKIKEFCDENEK
jgi:hypothetical protein